MSTKKKKVKAHNMHYVDLPWCCDTQCVDVKDMHSLDYDMQETMRERDTLHHSNVFVV